MRSVVTSQSDLGREKQRCFNMDFILDWLDPILLDDKYEFLHDWLESLLCSNLQAPPLLSASTGLQLRPGLASQGWSKRICQALSNPDFWERRSIYRQGLSAFFITWY